MVYFINLRRKTVQIKRKRATRKVKVLGKIPKINREIGLVGENLMRKSLGMPNSGKS